MTNPPEAKKSQSLVRNFERDHLGHDQRLARGASAVKIFEVNAGPDR
jgi:hypothetical protein